MDVEGNDDNKQAVTAKEVTNNESQEMETGGFGSRRLAYVGTLYKYSNSQYKKEKLILKNYLYI